MWQMVSSDLGIGCSHLIAVFWNHALKRYILVVILTVILLGLFLVSILLKVIDKYVGKDEKSDC